MARCSKCGFVTTTEYLAAHERICGGKAKVAGLPAWPKEGGPYTSRYDWVLHFHRARYWEARCWLAVDALEEISARADLYHGWQQDIARVALEAIGQLPP